MSEYTIPTNLDQFGDNLTQEWDNAESDATDPIIIIEEQTFGRRVEGKTAFHIIVISNHWPIGTHDERAMLIERVARQVEPETAQRCRKYLGLTPEEAKELNLNFTFGHMNFDLNKPHDSEEFSMETIGSIN